MTRPSHPLALALAPALALSSPGCSADPDSGADDDPTAAGDSSQGGDGASDPSAGPGSANSASLDAGSDDATTGDPTSDTGNDPTDPTGEETDTGAVVPGELLFFDDFEYDVARDQTGKFAPDGPFVEHGWSWGKDAVENGTGAGGWMYTTDAIPGFAGSMPGAASSRVLCVESGAGTYAGVVDGAWRQTDFYLQYGDTDAGPLDTIPGDVWIQQWMYLADTPEQPSLIPPTARVGKWFYPTRNSYPSTDLEWLLNLTGVLIDSEVQSMGSSAELDIGTHDLGFHLNLTDTDDDLYLDDRPDATTSLGHCGADPAHLSTIDSNRWWLLRLHVDHTSMPGVVEAWIRPHGESWIPIIDTTSSPVVEWIPTSPEGHRGMRFPTTMNNWYQQPEQATTHSDWWIYVDDFAIAAGANAGGNGADDLPQYDDCPDC